MKENSDWIMNETDWARGNDFGPPVGSDGQISEIRALKYSYWTQIDNRGNSKKMKKKKISDNIPAMTEPPPALE